jgi:RimJ/RimL family protein N-acetyltransferase
VSAPRLRKADVFPGRTLAFRDAQIDDAAFIHGLRCDAHKSRHLSPVSPALSDQVAWLERYRTSTDQAYFIIERAHNVQGKPAEPLGTVRLYDAQGDSFCWGSWILKDDAPTTAAIESALMVYAYALDTLGFRSAHFQVRRDNQRVWAFHERFGATRVSEDASEFRYTLDNAAIRTAMQRYQRFLPTHPTVEA